MFNVVIRFKSDSLYMEAFPVSYFSYTDGRLYFKSTEIEKDFVDIHRENVRAIDIFSYGTLIRTITQSEL